MTSDITSDEQSRAHFPGFHDAERALLALRRRSTVYQRLQATHLYKDMNVAAVHVDHLSRADRDILHAYDFRGKLLDTLTLFLDEPQQKMHVADEFDHDITGMLILRDSDLAAAIAEDHGWIIDMAHVRDYDLEEDVQTTQRQMVLHQLAEFAAQKIDLRDLEHPIED